MSDTEVVVPEKFPVHPNLSVATDFTHSQFLNSINTEIGSVEAACETFIKYVSANPTLLANDKTKEYLSKQLAVLDDLHKAKARLELLRTGLGTLHRHVISSKRGDDYESRVHDFSESEVGDYFAGLMAADSESLPSQTLQFLKNALFVIKNPEDPLPDEEAEDEVSVAGGKISLKDPLSLEYFVEPVYLKKCKHVFEKEHILMLLLSSNDCPVTGCLAHLTKRDMEEDKLMALRVRAFTARPRRTVARI